MLETFVIIVLILFNAALSAFEMGLVTVKKVSLQSLMDKGHGKAKKVIEMREGLSKTLSAIQVGMTLAAILSGAMAGKLSNKLTESFLPSIGLIGDWYLSLTTFLLLLSVTYISVVFGELLPKTIAARFPVKIIFALQSLVSFLARIFRPFIWLLQSSTKISYFLLQKFGLLPRSSEFEAVEESYAIHRLTRTHRDYVFNLINIQKTSLRDILQPWQSVVTIDQKMTRDEITNILLECGHTRVPVCDGANVIGLLNAKELLARKNLDWQKLLHPIIKINVSELPLNVLRTMQSRKSHLSIVQDHNGIPLGIITIEDILEEIVGEIYDEDDEDDEDDVLFSTGLK